MKTRFFLTLAFSLTSTLAFAQAQKPTVDIDVMEKAVKEMFTKVSPEWQKRNELDETQRICTQTRNDVSPAQADAIQKRESANVVQPPNGKYLGNWKKGFEVANNGRGGQFSDPPGTVAGGNCFACHQLDPKELSYGTLGPSLTGYGKQRNYDKDAIADAWKKIYNSQSVVACSNMPRFGSMGILNAEQIQDVMAYLFDPESPVNK